MEGELAFVVENTDGGVGRRVDVDSERGGVVKVEIDGAGAVKRKTDLVGGDDIFSGEVDFGMPSVLVLDGDGGADVIIKVEIVGVGLDEISVAKVGRVGAGDSFGGDIIAVIFEVEEMVAIDEDAWMEVARAEMEGGVVFFGEDRQARQD